MHNQARILISRTDNIGDMVLTLPMATVLKEKWPECKIIFLGRNYTRDVVALSEKVDEFVSYDDWKDLPVEEQVEEMKKLKLSHILHVYPRKEIAMLAEKAGVPQRIGTMSRLYHWYTCNQKIHLPRRNAKRHEAQLNLQMLRSLGLKPEYTSEQIAQLYGLGEAPPLPDKFQHLLDPDKFNLILHPRSKGSAREWGLENFNTLLSLLPVEKYQVFVSGTAAEGDSMRKWIEGHSRLHDVTGLMNLREFIAFINSCDGLVAASTGPLHLAAALGKTAIGLFAPIHPIHPARWKPLGPKAAALALDKRCTDCEESNDCHCIREIPAQQIVDLLAAV